ncbi:HelD family protein [Candidatus Enterococcus clewellii]|uniref:DNA helicase II/ATP-dependent DNA helicase PcrA n=1 Tax=Candidatus Enterococcus clewellii TaxID=1834193 RepID=A0A242JZ01_9ENTE|nr:UvrD-helicase domain-containing protein [Enterococcus sp. 9E7_DIV0242]OTP10556.1 hypothetical protein A5888_003854 [Enterococcus sp. 9E7_DIV0242]
MDRVTAEEQANWKVTKKLLQERKAEIDAEISGFLKESEQFQHYLTDYRGEIDPHEMFTNLRLQEQQFIVGSFRFRQLEKIEKQLQQPYFTRVDFVFSGETTAEIIYIGSFSFAAGNGELLIYDWRAPIAGIFYDFDIGSARYQAPNGMVFGEITRKRQVKFVEGAVDYAIETEATLFDEVLQKELMNQRGGKMSTIIRTIQKEQNQIIRNHARKSMIIQGVAGSGKTSIALHRIAFLLYQLREQLTSNEILILSPNKVFAEYISEVLPELGEEPVNEFSIDTFIAEMTGVQPEISRLEETEQALLTGEAEEELVYLSTARCVQELDAFLEAFQRTGFRPKPVVIGEYTFEEEYLLKRFNAYRKQPILERLERMAGDMLEAVATKPFQPKKKPTIRGLSNQLKSRLRYRTAEEAFAGFRDNLPFSVGRKGYSVLFVLAYIQLFFERNELLQDMKYIVIDEMQDYTPLQFNVLQRALHCPVLLIGDYTQQIVDRNEMTLDKLTELFPKANVMNLSKSYRSTYEIMMFAKALINDDVIQPMVRHGEMPRRIIVKNVEEEKGELLNVIDKSLKLHATIALITKTHRQAENWYNELKHSIKLVLLNEQATTLTNQGVVICSVAISKGLEFDHVIGLDTQEENFQGAAGKQQLFVIATRALHLLTFIERSDE